MQQRTCVHVAVAASSSHHAAAGLSAAGGGSRSLIAAAAAGSAQAQVAAVCRAVDATDSWGHNEKEAHGLCYDWLSARITGPYRHSPRRTH
jgi:hypothetical protein